jgi:hypothetical protein
VCRPFFAAKKPDVIHTVNFNWGAIFLANSLSQMLLHLQSAKVQFSAAAQLYCHTSDPL